MDSIESRAVLQKARGSAVVLKLWKSQLLRPQCLRWTQRFEGGQLHSWTLRRVFEKYHGVSVGAYSYGVCFRPDDFPPGVKIGRYVSIARGVLPLLRSHPADYSSLHPFFFNEDLGLVPPGTIPSGELTIEDDCWIGARAIILPSCRRLGLGSIIGAGAVVAHYVPDFAVVAGCPARVLRYRFFENVRKAIRNSRWWLRSIEECTEYIEHMSIPLGVDWSRHPLLDMGEEQVKPTITGNHDGPDED